MARYVNRGVHGQTVETIAKRILGGTLAEGETLDIAALQVELDVSLTVVRETLKVLAAKGMVDARQKRGTFVRPRSDWNLLDGDVLRWQFASSASDRMIDQLQEVRGIVEPASARLAAERRDDADLAALESALTAMEAAGDDPASQIAADLNFHRALLAATHNELLQRMEVMLEIGLAERDRLVHYSQHHDDPIPSHRAVLDAIRAGDPAAAENAMGGLLDQAAHDLHKARGGPGAKGQKR
ncbi:GntR family transcriptional regulator [Longispora fulva]|uniref:DNA-binding FadR family transcriptional regulator n=1 Tax=Longispora fulva TaxID=619741 RepID=A0A8J7G6L2_9ACTN|nr:FadR/GntR family transcriptional regulator [Longispora fulva]MBG6133865.1 DNA-binding FadR family transcriptional regulator [Longispora fulva]GIG62905.1 GntR family transcriptional regulator [Longispora fulva]